MPTTNNEKISARITELSDKIDRLYALESVMNDLDNYVYDKSFSYQFVPLTSLTPEEQKTFKLSDSIVSFLRQHQFKHNIEIKVSETIRVGIDGALTLGVYDSEENAIIIKRSILNNPTVFCSALLHEFAHYQHGYLDNTRAFENDLTEFIGHLFMSILEVHNNPAAGNSLFLNRP